MRRHKLLWACVSLLLFVLTLTSCQQQQSKKEQQPAAEDYKEFTVTAKTLSSTLYFSGSLKPLKIFNVPTPVEGIVIERYFKYGQKIKKEQLLFKIDSEKVESNFNSALTEFLNAKDKLDSSRIQLEGVRELNKLGEIKANELREKESSYNNANISYLQKLYKFEDAAKLSPANVEVLKKLTIADIPEISKYLLTKYNFFDIRSTAEGVALIPPKTGGKDSSGGIVVGSSVKQNQVLVSVGNLDGLSATININEIDINQVKAAQEVVITGVAFPKFELKGYVQEVESQAQSTRGALGGLPTFTAIVIVPKLTPEQKKVIKVGMSAKIKVIIKHPDVLMIPIDAVFEKKGQRWVRKKVNGKVEEVPVITGETTFNDVEVTNGLKAGDVILYIPGDVVVTND